MSAKTRVLEIDGAHGTYFLAERFAEDWSTAEDKAFSTAEEAHLCCTRWEREHQIPTTVTVELTSEQATALCRGWLVHNPGDGQELVADVAAKTIRQLAQALADAQRRPGCWERQAFESMGLVP